MNAIVKFWNEISGNNYRAEIKEQEILRTRLEQEIQSLSQQSKFQQSNSQSTDLTVSDFLSNSPHLLSTDLDGQYFRRMMFFRLKI